MAAMGESRLNNDDPKVRASAIREVLLMRHRNSIPDGLEEVKRMRETADALKDILDAESIKRFGIDYDIYRRRNESHELNRCLEVGSSQNIDPGSKEEIHAWIATLSRKHVLRIDDGRAVEFIRRTWRANQEWSLDGKDPRLVRFVNLSVAQLEALDAGGNWPSLARSA